jgi:hypothetical protein
MDGMSSEKSHKEAMKEYLGIPGYSEVLKSIMEDLYSRVLSDNY